MPSCTFFGHRNCPETIKQKLREVLLDLIANHGVDMFYVGHQGQFDAIVRSELREWAVSATMVRRYCKEGKIPKAILTNEGWSIPQNTKKPSSTPFENKANMELSPLAKKLIIQKKKKSFHGLYDYVMINLTYSSNRMASNRLTGTVVDLDQYSQSLGD